MCNCSGLCECGNTSMFPIGNTGATGAAGTNGTNGTNGLFGGFSGRWLFNAATTSTPGATELRLNNSISASTTVVYLNVVNANSIDQTNFLLSFANSNRFGLIRIFDELDSSKFAYFRVTAVLQVADIIVLTVTYIDSNGAFTAGNKTIISFQPNALGPTSIDYMFSSYQGGINQPYVTTNSSSGSNSVTPVIVGYFIYEGTSYYGAPPTLISVIGGLSFGRLISRGIVTIYNVTAGITIATSNHIGDTPGRAIYDLTLGTIPSVRSLCYVSVNNTVAYTGPDRSDNEMTLYSLNFKF